MKYLQLNCVADAYKKISESTKDKFWGILGVMYSVNTYIEPNKSYVLDTRKLSNFLEQNFRLTDKRTYDNTTSVYSAVFSNRWTDVLSRDFLNGKPNILPIIAWAYRRHEFETEANYSELIELFINDFHLSKDVFEELFVIESEAFSIAYSEELYDETDLLFEIDPSIDPHQKVTLKLGKEPVVANAGDLSRGPFFQPLYASLNTLECLTIYPFITTDVYNVFNKKFLTDGEPARNMIFHGAPGTGKTYRAKRYAEELVSGHNELEKELTKEEKERIGFIQFHPSYDYTDFVEGLKPDPENAGAFKRYDGIFKSFCKKALKDSQNNKYVFIIDEINRGELSKIFGELFYALEPNYRGEKGRIKTQYNYLIDKDDVFKDGFFIPENVYIVGTMNDVDRGVEALDFAIRRRFAWIEVTAKESIQQMGITGDAKAKLEKVNELLHKYGFSDAYHIGGSYFLGITDFKKLWDQHLANILREYLRGESNRAEKFSNIRNEYFNTKA